MTYFHRRTSTIIGAKAFHCPVRDGKEWDHLAMVVRRRRFRAARFWTGAAPAIGVEARAPGVWPGAVVNMVCVYGSCMRSMTVITVCGVGVALYCSIV